MKKKINFIPAIIIIVLCALLVGTLVVLVVLQNKDVVRSSFFRGETEERVTLVTNKIEYGKGEEVKITIKNNTNGQIEFGAIGIGQTEHKKDANIWNVIRFDTDCLCMALCKKAPMYLNAGEESEFTWNQKDDSCEQASSGIYKARVDWFDPTAEYMMGEAPASVSNEFIIK